MSKAKRNSLVFLAIATLLIIILAMSLSNLTLSPGQPFTLEEIEPGELGLNPLSPDGSILIWIFRGTVALMLILLILYLVYSLMTSEGRKRLIANALMIVILFWLADYLRNNLPTPTEQPEQPMSAAAQPDQLGESIPATLFPTEPPQWLTLAVILGISVLISVFVGVMFWFFWQRRKKEAKSPLDALAEEAQIAIEALNVGGDFRLTIIHCYQEMSRVLKAEKGIARESAMTPREFESQLVGKGLPPTSIKTLTRLFEQARYGSVSSQTSEEDLALSCLTEIVDACRTIGNRYEA